MASWREIMAGPGNVQDEEAAASAREPGWYPDPGGSGSQRYWDGAEWGQLFDADPEEEAPRKPQGKANRLAVTALICSTCVPFLLVAGALGVTFGYIALDEIEESEGRERGESMAQWAIGLGFLNLALSAVAIGLVVWLVVRG